MPSEDSLSPRTNLEGDIFIINDVPKEFVALIGRRGASSRGKERTTIEIKSEALLHDFDENVLGAAPAEAIRAILEKQTKGITEFVSDSTAAMRKKAAIAFAASEPWAMRRYSGGRIGPKAPNQTRRKFNDSGRLAEGYFVRENKEDRTWTVNLPANRGDPAVMDELRELVPALSDIRSIGSDPDFQSAVSKSIAELITKGELRGDAQQIQKLKQLAATRRRALLAAARAVRDLVR